MSTDASSAPADRLDTLPPESLDPGYWFRPGVLTLGHEAIAWAHKWLVQPNGPRSGMPFRYTPRQRRFLLHWYELDLDGRWKYHHGVRRLAKGSGKSPFAGAFSLTEFCADVRLAHIEDPEHPDPRQRVSVKPVDLPLIQIAATAESQTKNTMRMVRAFAHKKSAVVAEYQIDPGKTIYYKLPEGTLEVITSSATAAEGSENSAVVADETEHWKPSNGGPELASTLADNLAKSGSRMLETANAWVPDEGSVAEATWDAWVAQEEGRTRAETKILYDAVVAPADTDMADRGSLLGALRSVYEDCPWVDPVVIMNRVQDLRSKPDDSQRKYLNRPAISEFAWTTGEDWGVLAAPEVVVEPGEDIVAFFDGSKSEDATALFGCRISDGHVMTLAVWEKPPGPEGEGWEVPYDEVDGVVDWMFDTWRVHAFFGDVKEWESYVNTSWPARHTEKLTMWAQRDRSPIAWDMRSHDRDFTIAAEECLTEIENRAFTHDGNPATQRHIVNATRRPGRWGVSVKKKTKAKKIDAAVCVIGVRMVRRLLLASKEWADYQRQSEKKPGRLVGFG